MSEQTQPFAPFSEALNECDVVSEPVQFPYEALVESALKMIARINRQSPNRETIYCALAFSPTLLTDWGFIKREEYDQVERIMLIVAGRISESSKTPDRPLSGVVQHITSSQIF